MKKAIKFISRAALVGAIYAVLTLALYPISFGAVQFRLSEALTLLPLLIPEAIPGLFVGCIVANLLSPNIVVLDVVFGSLATLIAAVLTSRVKSVWLAPLPPVICNALIVGAVIAYSEVGAGAGFWAAYLFNLASVGFGELVVCYALGVPLILALRRVAPKIGFAMTN
ncbi:MAG TPA: QueT transporter family protein [Bacillota bacterium]|nr:QueT transporter family protein [Clostridiales bacterium]HPT85673.1 QueT transporter family protein [Bacillota bacterium]